ncbi:MAG: glycosyltransferase family 4 protein [Actinomycetota bacterium]
MSGPVVIDLQAAQSRHHGERGIGRWAYEFTAAVCAARPELIGAVVFNPRLPVPAVAEALAATGKVDRTGTAAASARVYHVLSPFEPDEAAGAIWPEAVRGASLVVTLYDLIPELYAARYLADPGWRRRYRTRQLLVRAADRVLAISEATRHDAISRLGLDPRRVVNVGAGISGDFAPAAHRRQAFARAQGQVARLEPGFLLSVGGEDERKNLSGLLAGYAEVAPELRRDHQLVVACNLSDAYRAQLSAQASSLGISSRVRFTGYVDDATLIALYQSTELFVFPPFSEGFGLPLAEAMACGALAVGSGTSATAELVDPAGAFDPSDPSDIARAITAALGDPATRAALAAASAAPAPSWDQVAQKAATAYEELLGDRPDRHSLATTWYNNGR